MDRFVLKAQPRKLIGKQVKTLRRSGGLPAVLYGKGFDPIPITLDAREASRLLSTVTTSNLLTIDLDGEELNALVRDRQRHPILSNLMHVDFLVVSMTEKLRTEVVIELEGVSPAVRDQSAALVTGVESLEVESLPRDLPGRIMVDISELVEVGDTIYVKDLKLPSGVEVLTDPEEMVVLTTYQIIEEVEEEEEEEELFEAYAEEEPEVIERGKREEEEEF